MHTKQSSSNIKWIYLITFLGECYLTMAVWLFFYTRYLTFSEITTLVVMQQIVQLVLEIPTGAIADLLGKRKTLIASYFFYFASLALTPFFSTFWAFFILEFLKGVAKSLSSGTFEALTYDSLKEDGKEGEYPKVTANITTIAWAAYIPAGAIGGFLFDLSFYIPYLLLASFYLFATLILIAKVKEPAIDTEHGVFTFRKYAKQTVEGFKELFSSRKLGILIIFLLLCTVGYYTGAEFLGISQGKAYGLSATSVSLIFTAGTIVSAILSQVFTRLVPRFSAFMVALMASLFMFASYLFAVYVSPTIGMLLIASRISSRSTFDNSRSYMINKEISSKNRATALSTFSLLYTLPYVFITFFGGKIIDMTSANHFALLLGLGLGVGILLTFFMSLLLLPKTSTPDELQR